MKFIKNIFVFYIVVTGTCVIFASEKSRPEPICTNDEGTHEKHSSPASAADDQNCLPFSEKKKSLRQSPSLLLSETKITDRQSPTLSPNKFKSPGKFDGLTDSLDEELSKTNVELYAETKIDIVTAFLNKKCNLYEDEDLLAKKCDNEK